MAEQQEDEETMMSRAVPVIDLREFEEEEDEDDQKAYTKLREACEEWGCFRITNHSVPLDLMSEMKIVVRSLLDLPPEIKARNADVLPGSGYVAPTPANPLYEAFGIHDFGSAEARRCFCDQLDASPYQREIIERYGRAMHGLGLEMGTKIAQSLGLEGDQFKDWPFQLRINKYNFSDLTLGSSGVQIHTDNSLLTILQQDEDVRGLEIITKNGEFVAVDPSPGSLLLNLGDITKVWSNGRFHNVKHRVLCKEATIRVSIASFMLGPKEEDVEPSKDLVDDEHPPLYLPFNYEYYRLLRLSTKKRAGEALELLQQPLQNNSDKNNQ